MYVYQEQKSAIKDHRYLNSLLYAVYAWMAVALGCSAITAYTLAQNENWFAYIQAHPMIFLGIMLVQLVLVMVISFAINRLNFITALTLFLLYAFSMGVTLSTIFFVYTTASIGVTFIVTAGMFGAMSLYGYFTKADLSSLGSMALMALFGLILAMLVNLWWQNSTFDIIISAAGVVIFTLLTAYDVQRIKYMMQQYADNEHAIGQITIIGALTLYLDFINLFLMLLRFMGQRKD